MSLLDLDDAEFLALLRKRTKDITQGPPRTPCDIVFMGADSFADLERLKDLKRWIEPNGAIWVVRAKGARATIKDIDVIKAGLDAGLVDNKIASLSDTHGAMRLVFRLRDRPK